MTRPSAPSTVRPRDFPQLALLAWNRDTALPITAAEAFGLYESQWRHVDVARLGPEEAALVDLLTQEFGNGVFLAAGGRQRKG